MTTPVIKRLSHRSAGMQGSTLAEIEAFCARARSEGAPDEAGFGIGPGYGEDLGIVWDQDAEQAAKDLTSAAAGPSKSGAPAVHPAAALGLRDPSTWQPGVVGMTDWWSVPWSDRKVLGVYGQVLVVQSSAALGFDIRGGDHANWLAIVKGMSTVFAVPGCKVRLIAYDTEVVSSDFIEVP